MAYQFTVPVNLALTRDEAHALKRALIYETKRLEAVYDTTSESSQPSVWVEQEHIFDVSTRLATLMTGME